MILAAVASMAVVAEDWRSDPPFAEAVTQKSLGEISGCLGGRWQQRSGQTSYVPSAGGFSMRLTYSVFGQPVVAVEVSASDVGNERRVEVRARKGDRSQKLRREIEACT